VCVCTACAVKLNGNREVTGVLRGFDQFMNLVVEDTVEKTGAGPEDKQNLGMVVLRGNSVLMIECLEKL
jgi:small nuclear ribonucleoprotein G